MAAKAAVAKRALRHRLVVTVIIGLFSGLGLGGGQLGQLDQQGRQEQDRQEQDQEALPEQPQWSGSGPSPGLPGYRVSYFTGRMI